MAIQLKGWVTQTSFTTISVTLVLRLIPGELNRAKRGLVTHSAGTRTRLLEAD